MGQSDTGAQSQDRLSRIETGSGRRYAVFDNKFYAARDATTVKIQWTATTAFVGVDATMLFGKTVEVEGALSKGVLTATKIAQEM